MKARLKWAFFLYGQPGKRFTVQAQTAFLQSDFFVICT
jgi:hypothetical protein